MAKWEVCLQAGRLSLPREASREEFGHPSIQFSSRVCKGSLSDLENQGNGATGLDRSTWIPQEIELSPSVQGNPSMCPLKFLKGFNQKGSVSISRNPHQAKVAGGRNPSDT